MAVKFNEKELISNGIYTTYGEFGGSPYPDVEILNTPITPKENILNFFKGRGYEWVPDWTADYFDFSVDIIPDVIAMGTAGGKDIFGVTWEPVENGLPAMIRPGNPKLKSMADWRNLTWPDIDSWDWEGCVEKYVDTLDRSRIIRPYIQCALFERMIALMDFENALYALVDEPEECKAFLERMADYNIDLIDHYIKYFHVDAICLLDDWSSQKAPFFSVEMAREILFPPLKRIVRHVKDLGLLFTWHSCGNGVSFIPMMIEAGIDGWQLQNGAADLDEAIKQADGKVILETSRVFPFGAEEGPVKEEIAEFVSAYGKDGTCTFCFCDEYYCTPAYMRREAYRLSRMATWEAASQR